MLLTILYTLVCVCLSVVVNTVLDGPYMDEIFHIRQTQTYCEHNFHIWDDKITTLPGLYIAALIPVELARPLSLFSCDANFMRSFNLFLGLCTFGVVDELLRELHHGSFERSNWQRRHTCSWTTSVTTELLVVELCTHPLFFFFIFLFYTDVGSILFVLAMYLMMLRRNRLASCLCGIVAILFRQTNVVWVVFTAAASVVRLHESRRPQRKNQPGKALAYVAADIVVFVKFCLTNFAECLSLVSPYLVVVGGFVVFVVLNGGIVVGDRSNHAATFHVVQVFYFLAFTMPFQFARVLSPDNLRCFFVSARRHVTLASLAFGALIVAVMLKLIQEYSHAHEFILADNRHYVFYLCNRFFCRYSWAKYSAVPLYVASFWLLTLSFDKRCSTAWQFAFWLCTSMTLVPASLVEFRYFVVPFFFLSLHSSEQFYASERKLVPQEKYDNDSQSPSASGYEEATRARPSDATARRRSKRGKSSKLNNGALSESGRRASKELSSKFHIAQICSQIAVNIGVNAFTLYMFIFRPFVWPDGSEARFMW